MAATDKSELLRITAGEFNKLAALVDAVESDAAMKKQADDTSIKDVVAHRAHWISLFLGWYHDGMAGKPVHFPAEGYKWNDLKRYNADLRHRQRHVDWPGAKALLMENHEALMRFIEEHSNDDLYNGPMKGAKNAWAPGRWAEAAGASHYRSASKFIRASILQDAAPAQ